MNVSGPWAIKAWRWAQQQQQQQQQYPGPLNMAVVHDEMNLSFGNTKSRNWNTANSGHRGLESICPLFEKEPGLRKKISVGIGRPTGGQTVPEWVLSGLNKNQIENFRGEGGVADTVLFHLDRILEMEG